MTNKKLGLLLLPLIPLSAFGIVEVASAVAPAKPMVADCLPSAPTSVAPARVAPTFVAPSSPSPPDVS